MWKFKLFQKPKLSNVHWEGNTGNNIAKQGKNCKEQLSRMIAIGYCFVMLIVEVKKCPINKYNSEIFKIKEQNHMH